MTSSVRLEHPKLTVRCRWGFIIAALCGIVGVVIAWFMPADTPSAQSLSSPLSEKELHGEDAGEGDPEDDASGLDPEDDAARAQASPVDNVRVSMSSQAPPRLT